jgi:adenylate cyclase, class 2
MAILAVLGYPQILEVKKLRKSYSLGEITACIDHVDSLGDFLELEKLVDDKKDHPEAVDELYKWLSRLEISKDYLTQYSYLELLLKKIY